MAKRAARQALSGQVLDTLYEDLQQLRVAYERFFLGIERMPPERARIQFERALRRLTTGAMGSTALRFRLDSLRGRFVTYSQHWRRVCRQIEEGTYVRVVAQAERRQRLAAFEARLDRERAIDESRSPGSEPDTQPPTPAQDSGPGASRGRRITASGSLLPPPVPRRPSSAQRVPGVDVGESRALFAKYVAAKEAAGQSTRGLSYAGMMQQIARQMPAIQARHAGPVRFEVSSSGGQVRLLARPTAKGSK